MIKLEVTAEGYTCPRASVMLRHSLSAWEVSTLVQEMLRRKMFAAVDAYNIGQLVQAEYPPGDVAVEGNWYCTVEGTPMGTMPHKTFAEAKQEAARLARKCRKRVFVHQKLTCVEVIDEVRVS